MRRLVLIAPFLLLSAGGIWALGAGLDMRLAAWAAEWQREFQAGLATSLRALRAGEPGALALMLGICFGYGFCHAVGPGHGKILIGGYGLGRDVPLLRLSAISLLSALGQAATAIALVASGLFALGWTRQRLTDTAENVMLPLSTLAVSLVGIWLVVRGARRLWRRCAPLPAIGHNRVDAEGVCGCGRRHGPTPEDMAGGGSARETMALVASIAIRPCSGAILLLVLTWYMDIFTAGLMGTVAMSLGTAVLTVAVGALSVFARRTTVMSLNGQGVQIAVPILEIAAGLCIALVSLEMAGGPL